MPPPPTMPMTDAERMSDSKRSSRNEKKFGSTWGMTPKLITWSRPAPTAATPSIWPGSTASMASLRSLPSTPPVWMPSASVPANGPRPHRGDEHQREHEFVHRAQDVHEASGGVVDDRMGRAVARAQQAERNRKGHREHRAPEGDAQGHHALPGVLADVDEGGMKVAAQEGGDVTGVPQELEGTKLDHPRRQLD
jgi:hypothetical protein